MTTRTITETITFSKPFTLGDFDEVLPAGAYIVETEAEPMHGLSFSAYRRTSTRFQIPAKSGNAILTRVLIIKPSQLDAAVLRDKENKEHQVSDNPLTKGNLLKD